MFLVFLFKPGVEERRGRAVSSTATPLRWWLCGLTVSPPRSLSCGFVFLLDETISSLGSDRGLSVLDQTTFAKKSTTSALFASPSHLRKAGTSTVPCWDCRQELVLMSIGQVWGLLKWSALVRSASSVTRNDLLHTYSGYRILEPDASPRGAVEIRAVVLRLNHAWNMIALWSIQTYAVSNDFISDALQKAPSRVCSTSSCCKAFIFNAPSRFFKPHLVQLLLETNWKFEVVEELRVDFWSTMPMDYPKKPPPFMLPLEVCFEKLFSAAMLSLLFHRATLSLWFSCVTDVVLAHGFHQRSPNASKYFTRHRTFVQRLLRRWASNRNLWLKSVP